MESQWEIADLAAPLRAATKDWPEVFDLLQSTISVDADEELDWLNDWSLSDVNRSVIAITEFITSFEFESSDGDPSLAGQSSFFHRAWDGCEDLQQHISALHGQLKQIENGEAKVTTKSADLKIQVEPQGEWNIGQQLRKISGAVRGILDEFLPLTAILSVRGIDDLTDRAEAIERSRKQAESELQKIAEIKQAVDGHIATYDQRMQNLNSAVERVEKSAGGIKESEHGSNEALGRIKATLAVVDEIGSTASDVKASVTAYQSEFSAFDGNLERRKATLQKFEEDTAKAFEDNSTREQTINELIEKSDSMIRGATVAGLSHSLDEARQHYEKQMRNARTSFYVSIVVLFIVCASIASSVLPIPWISESGEGTTGDTTSLAGLFAKIIFLIPAWWFTNFTAKRHAALFQIEREYAFKAAIAKSVDGFRRESATYAEDIVAAVFFDLREKPEFERPKDAADRPRSRNPVADYFLKKLKREIENADED